MKLDSHQHFWRYTEADYPWMEPGWPIRRDQLPADLLPLLHAAGLDGCIAVQARQSLEENRFLLDLADRHPFIRGVVGWVDLQSEQVADQLAKFARHPRAVGVRHVAQDEPDDRFLVRPEVLRGIEALAGFDLTYDILIFPKQLPAVIELVGRFPKQPFVLDHLAKPLIRDGVLEPWRALIRELAQAPNCSCKVSGMVTEARPGAWRAEDFQPYLDVVWEAFGEERLMFGSDWPVCLLNGDYAQVTALVRDYVRQQASAAEDKVFGANAARFYGLSEQASVAPSSK